MQVKTTKHTVIDILQAYQHFLYYIDVNHLFSPEYCPWTSHLANHFRNKLTYYQETAKTYYLRPDVIITWIQNMTTGNQAPLFEYILKYHINKW